MSEVQKTPLYDTHLEMGAKMVEFAGWNMPVQYKGLKEEHLHVREKAGAFDVSHMGEIWVRGPKALETLQWITTNNVAKLQKGEAQYSLFPNEQGGIVDDLIVYCMEPNQEYLLCVNAANVEKDFAFVKANNRGADLENASSNWGQIAIHGPLAMDIVTELMGSEMKDVKTFNFRPWTFQGATCYVARTGYTGEDGVEVFVPKAQVVALWKQFFEVAGDRLQPIGLGARDTLRLEKKLSLYGQEITDTTNPYSAGLGWVVKPKDKEFLGRDVMVQAKEKGLAQKLIGIELSGRGIARSHYKVFSFDKKEIGEVTSGTLSPSTNKAIAIAYVAKDQAEVGTDVFVDIRGKMIEAKVVPTPFV